MRFLKEMIAGGSRVSSYTAHAMSVTEETGPEMVPSTLDNTMPEPDALEEWEFDEGVQDVEPEDEPLPERPFDNGTANIGDGIATAARSQPASDADRAAAPVSVRIWEMFDMDDDEPDAEDEDEDEDSDPETVRPEQARSSGPSDKELARSAMELIRARGRDNSEIPPAMARGGRAKTRLIGFNAAEAMGADVFDEKPARNSQHANLFPVGWLVVTNGPGRGTSFTLQSGVSQIGRGEGQGIRLDFGDSAISRENHAAIAFDDEQNAFFIGHGGKANIVRLNGRPILSTEELSTSDHIRIGETTLRFVAMCGPEFGWDEAGN